MSDDLFEAVVKTPQREVAGADTSSRFDYQKNWAFCHMLDKHYAGNEYLVAFEFHDDVVFFDSEKSPSNADFYQVKTSKTVKPRTMASLTARKKEANSIIGKMISNAQKIGNQHSIKMILVSNNAYEFSLNDICAKDVDKKYRDKLLEKLKVEFPDTEDEILEKLHFIVTEVPVNDIGVFLKGKAMELFEKRFGINFTLNVASWLRLVQGEIVRKNNFPPDKIETVHDLIDKKCIGRAFIKQTLDDIEKRHNTAPDLVFVSDELKQHGWSGVQVLKFNKTLPSAVADFQDPTNDECLELQRRITISLEKISYGEMNIAAALEAVFADLTQEGLKASPYANKEYLCALTLLVLNEKL